MEEDDPTEVKDKGSTEPGVRPPNVSTAQQRRCKLPIPLFFSVFHSNSRLLFLLQRQETGQMGYFRGAGAQEDPRPSGKAGAAT